MPEMTITSLLLQLRSKLQHIYHGQPNARVDFSPSQGLWIWPLKSYNYRQMHCSSLFFQIRIISANHTLLPKNANHTLLHYSSSFMSNNIILIIYNSYLADHNKLFFLKATSVMTSHPVEILSNGATTFLAK
jgi:hypothetical protein